MSEEETTGNMRVVSAEDAGEGTADLAAVPTGGGSDFHVINLRGGAGWDLSHPADCPDPASCRFTEAAGRISQAVCATEGRWTCDVSGGALMLLDRLGD